MDRRSVANRSEASDHHWSPPFKQAFSKHSPSHIDLMQGITDGEPQIILIGAKEGFLFGAGLIGAFLFFLFVLPLVLIFIAGAIGHQKP